MKKSFTTLSAKWLRRRRRPRYPIETCAVRRTKIPTTNDSLSDPIGMYEYLQEYVPNPSKMQCAKMQKLAV